MTDAQASLLSQATGASLARGVNRAEARIASGDALDVRRFEVSERMSSLFEVQPASSSRTTPTSTSRPSSARPMTFSRPGGGETRTWAGVCSRPAAGRGWRSSRLSTYELTLVPTLWLATQRRNHRMFQLMSGDRHRPRRSSASGASTPTMKLSGTYKKRKYRVQYGESDYAFVWRMLEDAGVSFYFDNGGESRLVLDDGPQAQRRRARRIAFRDQPERRRPRARDRGARRPPRAARQVHGARPRLPPARQPTRSSASAAGAAPASRSGSSASTTCPGAFLYESDKGDSTPHRRRPGQVPHRRGRGRRARAAPARRQARDRAKQVDVPDQRHRPRARAPSLSFLDHPKSELAPGKRLLVVESTLSGELPTAWLHDVHGA